MNTVFHQDFFIGNRASLREAYGGSAPIVVTANGLLQRNGDSAFAFRQDSSFWYLTGISDPDVTLVIDGIEEYLIVPGRDAVRQAFDGSVSPELLSAISGIGTVLDELHGWERLSKGLKRVATPAAMPGYVERHGIFSNPARAWLFKRLRQLNPDLEFDDLRPQLMRLRSVKQPVELAAIRRAIRVTIDGLKLVTRPQKLAKYRYEYELEADLAQSFRRQGSKHAFEPIVAGGPRACQLHYLSNDGPVEPGQLVVLDVGAEANNYAADISRTVAIGTPSKRQQQVYGAVLSVQEYALSLLKPGTLCQDYEKQVEAYMGEKLRELGLIKTADHASVRKYYPHATSHFMGLDVHDVGDYLQPLAPGMVLTCEPGIYIPEEGIGVRIEDDVLITEAGHEVLTAALPRRLN